jgi:hypothetical protein
MQRGIERHFKVTIFLERRMTDVYVLSAPDGQSPAIRDARDDAGSGFSGGSFSFSLPAFDDVAPTPESFRARFPTEESWRKAMTATSISSISMANGTMDEFLRSLEEALDRPVVDETGLPGRYDIDLHGDREDGGTIFKRVRDELGLMLTADSQGGAVHSRARVAFARTALERRRRRARVWRDCRGDLDSATEGGDRLADRLAHRDGQHQRRLADGLAAEDDAGCVARSRNATSNTSGISDHDGSL